MIKKLKKVGLCFITGYFIKPFKIMLNHFFFNRSFCSLDLVYFASSFAVLSLLFDIRMEQELSKGEIGKCK